MSTHIALLRGINVGGHRRLPMAELRALCAGIGWADVRTYIQSGNVVFSADHPVPADLAAAIHDAYGYDVPVVLRTAAELTAALEASPFREAHEADRFGAIMFLSAVPDPAAVAAFPPPPSDHDRFEVKGAEVHLHYGRGAGKSRLTGDHFERRLGVRATARNLRTVLKLITLAR